MTLRTWNGFGTLTEGTEMNSGTLVPFWTFWKTTPHLGPAAAVAAAAFFLLCGYEFARGSSAALFQQVYGTANLPLVMALIPVAAGMMVYAYHLLLRRLGPKRSLFVSTLASAALLAGCTWGIHAGHDLFRAVLYVFREAYIVLLLEQCWSFVDSAFDEDFAKRFNGIYTGIGSIGAVLGGLIVGGISQKLGTIAMPLFAAALLLPAAYFGNLAYSKQPETPRLKESTRDGRPVAKSPPAEKRLLWNLFFLVLSSQAISTVLGLAFQSHLQQEIPALDAQTAFSGNYYALLNAASLVLQLAAAPILLKRVPLKIVHFGIPMVHAATALLLLLRPSLLSAGVAFLAFKALDYSLFRICKEMLYIPLSFNGRYRAKQDVDVIGYRLSKGGSSLAIMGMQKAGMAFAGLYPGIALVAALAWSGLLFRIFGATEKQPEKAVLS